MPKNNSKNRKDQRKFDADVRDKTASHRACGHYHTDNGWINCPSYPENQKIS